MAEKAKILILSTAYLPYIGGSELAIKNIIDRISEFDFHLITARLDKNLPVQERIGNVLVFRVGGFFSLLSFFLPKIFLPLAVFFKARLLIKANEYKLVHAFQASGAAGAGWLLKIFYPNLPFILTVQEGKDMNRQSILINYFRRAIIKKADHIIAISRYLQEYILKIKNNLSIKIIPNGVDIDSFSKQFSYGELADLENNLGIKPDDKVIISVSRLVDKNGLDLLIEGFYRLTTNDQRSTTNHKLLIIGEGLLRDNLKLKVESLNLEGKVIFTGSIRNEDLPKYLKISNVFVRPSRSEGLGSAFLEAMAAGIPIVGTKVGGIPDFLEDRKTGLFCSLNPDDIASKINIIFENDLLKTGMIKNARRLVEEKYDWDKIAEQYRVIFKNFNI